MSWEELDGQAPKLARLGKRLLEGPGVAFLGTTRGDGSPRLHPVTPIVREGELLLGIIDATPKAHDLLRDPRCVLHALPGPGHAEFWVEALAQALPSLTAKDWARRVPQLDLPPGDTLFRLVLNAAHATLFTPDGNGRPVPDRRHWRRKPALTEGELVPHGG
jgi:Pyridoxamine 5'-phosphate oxidase